MHISDNLSHVSDIHVIILNNLLGNTEKTYYELIYLDIGFEAGSVTSHNLTNLHLTIVRTRRWQSLYIYLS